MNQRSERCLDLQIANACEAIITTKKDAIPALPTPGKVHKYKFLLLST
jgi:hypothetical protein